MTTATANPKIVYSIQHLRGIAALLVLLRHTAKVTYPHHPFPVGQVGVDIFFAISGIVIYLTSRKLSWHVFLRRRIARIVPLYWLATAFTLLAAVAAGSLYSAHGVATTANTLGAFFFVPTFDGEGRAFPPIVAGWTLDYEMYFYAICAVVLALSWRTRFVGIVSAIIVAGIALGAVLFWGRGAEPGWAPLYLLLPITIEFVAGLWMAKLWSDGVSTPLWFNALLVLAAVGWLALAPTSEPYTPFRPIGWGVPALAIVWAALASERVIGFGRFRAGLLLGDTSYALYLIHPIALAAGFAVLKKLSLHLPAAVSSLAAVIGCIVAGILLHLFVELPLVRTVSCILGIGRHTASPAGMESASSPASTPNHRQA